MRSRSFGWVFVSFASLALSAACGSSGGGKATGGNDSGLEGGLDANELADVAQDTSPPVDASKPPADGGADGDAAADSSDGAPVCDWAAYSDGLSGASIMDMLFDARATSSVLYATAANKIFVSADGGQTWQTRGSFSNGSIEYLAAPANNSNVLLATSSAGIIHSTDSGKTWSLLSLGSLATDSIGESASQPLRVYAGVTGAGIFRSDDGGMTFSVASQGYPNAQTFGLDVAPDNPDEVVAGVQLLNVSTPGGALLRTTDGGQSWTTASQTVGSVWSLHRCVANASVLYAGVATGLAKSADRGVTWTVTALPNLAEDVAINPTNCNDVWVILYADGPRHSTDGGMTFGSPQTQGLGLVPLGTWPGRMLVDPQHTGDLLVGSHGGVWFSTNSGAQWSAAQGLLGLSARALGTTPLDPSRVWLATWGSGVWQRASSSVSWQRVPTSALPIDYTLTVAPDPKTAKRVIVGTNATLYQSSDSTTFSATSTVANDEFSVGYDPGNPNVLYVATQVAGVYKSVDGGATWTQSNGSLVAWATAAGTFIDTRVVVVDPANSQTVYLGTSGRGVYKSVDGATSWSNVLSPSGTVTCLVLAPGSPSTLYACLKGGGIQASTNGGTTWSDVSSGLPTLDIVGLVVDPTTGDQYATSSAGVSVRSGTGMWKDLDLQCIGGAGTPAIVTNGSQKSLLVTAGGGVYAHPL
jgi:hypothetical protein